MSSPSDRRHHKPATGGPSDKGGHKPRPFDDVVLDYEKFVSGERIRCRGEEAVVVYQREVYRPSTTGRTEVRSDQGESAKTTCLAHTGLLEAKQSTVEIKNLGEELRDSKKELEAIRQELVAGVKREELLLKKCESL
ncbi:hypothetical protein ACOSP7_030863 [Xanthoceras sorbifolium]